MITILNYGLGNLNSVANMIRHIGGQCKIASCPDELLSADKIILPGVGSFDAGMTALKATGLQEALYEKVIVQQTPILGICLGMQLMTERSEEGNLPGLGWLPGEVKRFAISESQKLSVKVPHMGWNRLTVTRPNALLSVEEECRFYFVHSYHVVCSEADTIARSRHGYDFVAAFAYQNIFGVQFHPEKSHRFGMKLLKNFMEI